MHYSYCKALFGYERVVQLKRPCPQKAMDCAVRLLPDAPHPSLQSLDPKRLRLLKLALFAVSLCLCIAAFVVFDYYYSRIVLASAVSGGSQGMCFSRDPVRSFAFQPNCSAVRPWLGASYKFETNSLGFRDEHVRQVSSVGSRPRILILGDSVPEGMTEWHDSVIGRIADRFPQYEFLNASVEGYSPSNYLNTERMLTRNGIHFDEAIVFVDISDVQDEASFFHDKGTSGAVATASRKVSKSSTYSNARLWINNHLLLTNDLLQSVEKLLVDQGWYHLDLGHGGNEFDLERSAWTYRKVSDTDPYEVGYGPLGVEGGIARSEAKMNALYRDLAGRNIPLSIVVYPWPAQLAHDSVDSRQVQLWRQWCEGRCRRFINMFPAFFAVKDNCSTLQPGCWYQKYFIFGDTHYNSAGDKVAAQVVVDSLTLTPPAKDGGSDGGMLIEADQRTDPTEGR